MERFAELPHGRGPRQAIAQPLGGAAIGFEQVHIGVTIPAHGMQQHQRLTELRFSEAALAHLRLDIRLFCTGIRSPRTPRPFPTRGSWPLCSS
jgi:hypothetical protein